MSFVIHHRKKDYIRLVIFLQVSFSLDGRVAAGRFVRLEVKVKQSFKGQHYECRAVCQCVSFKSVLLEI